MASDAYDTQPNSTIDEGITNFSEMELPVRLEVETLHMTLGQLATLEPGYVMELPVKLADARIRLVAHGQTVGLGELVAIGEQLGVRIAQMGTVHHAVK